MQCNIYKLVELHEAYLDGREDVYKMLDNEDADIGAMLSELVPPADGRGVHQLFPIQDEVAWGFYQTHIKSFWIQSCGP